MTVFYLIHCRVINEHSTVNIEYILFKVYCSSAWLYALFIMSYAVLTGSMCSLYFSTNTIINREDFLELMLNIIKIVSTRSKHPDCGSAVGL